MINVLHLIPDDKFVDFLICDFDRFSELNNSYVLLTDKIVDGFIYIKNTKRVEILIINSPLYNKLLIDKEIDLIVFHSLGSEIVKQFLRDLKVNPIVFWISWGWDYVSLIGIEQHKPQTKELIKKIYKYDEPLKKKNTLLKNKITRNIRRKIRYIFKYKERRIQRLSIKSLYKKIHFYSTVVPTEIQLFNKIPGLNANFLSYKIGFLENPFKNVDEIEQLGEAVWIGNSYTFSNNHLDVFYQLKELNVDKEIIVPLSYGLNTVEHPELITIGKEFFGDKFIPIINYMPFDEYNKLLKKSNIAIFNHIRQQAVGNVIMMLWQGTKVFMSELSPVYVYFKSMKFVLFSIENELTFNSINHSLSVEEIKQNKNIVFQLYSKGAIEKTNGDTIEYLIKEVRRLKFDKF